MARLLLKRRCLLLAVLALFLLVTSIWFKSPHFLSFYHTNIGSYLLLEALSSTDHLGVAARARIFPDLGSASANLEAALRWDHQNNGAYRQLGYAYAASGQLVEAAYVIQHPNELKSGDRPEFWKLGLIYQQIAEAIDLALEQNPSGQSAASGGTISLQAIRAPSCPPDIRDCPHATAIVAVVHPFSENAAFIPEARIRVLYLPPSAEVRFPMRVTSRENAFTFYLSPIEKDPQQRTKGVGVRVFIQQRDQQAMPVFTLDLAYVEGSEQWLGTTIDLSAWEGADIAVLLCTSMDGTSCESAQDTRSSQSQITIERLPSLAELWQGLDWDARLIVRQGDQARARGELSSAARWYKRAAILDPEAGYIWERLGTVYEEQRQWHKAILAYQRARDSADYQGITSLARIYTKLAMIPKWHFGDTDPNTIKSYLFSAIRVGDFPTRYDEADTHYKLAEILWDEGAFEGALRHLQLAVRSDPTYVWAHVLRGWALYRIRGDVRGAERELRLALDLGATGRQAYWAYRHLAVIDWHEGREAEAIAMFEDAFRADPSSGQTLTQLIEEATGESWSE